VDPSSTRIAPENLGKLNIKIERIIRRRRVSLDELVRYSKLSNDHEQLARLNMKCNATEVGEQAHEKDGVSSTVG